DRLRLRQDNADQRLTKIAFEAGLISPRRWSAFQRKLDLLASARQAASQTRDNGVPILQKLKRPDFTCRDISPNLARIAAADIWEMIEADAKCEGYARRHADQNRWLAERLSQRIPDGLDFSTVRGLSTETLQRLIRIRPTSIGQASRISGIT